MDQQTVAVRDAECRRLPAVEDLRDEVDELGRLRDEDERVDGVVVCGWGRGLVFGHTHIIRLCRKASSSVETRASCWPPSADVQSTNGINTFGMKASRRRSSRLR